MHRHPVNNDDTTGAITRATLLVGTAGTASNDLAHRDHQRLDPVVDGKTITFSTATTLDRFDARNVTIGIGAGSPLRLRPC